VPDRSTSNALITGRLAMVVGDGYCGVCFGVDHGVLELVVMVKGCSSRQAADCASSLLLWGVDRCFVLTK
jgi:hypothetical protein